MGVLAAFGMAARRWYLLLPLVVAAAGLAWVAYTQMPASHTATVTLEVQAPPEQPRATSRGAGLRPAAPPPAPDRVTEARDTAGELAASVKPAPPEGAAPPKAPAERVTLTAHPGTSAIAVRAVADSASHAARALTATTTQLTDRLAELQRREADDERLTLGTAVPVSVAPPVRTVGLRVGAAVLAFGLVMSVVLAASVERTARRRRALAEEPDPDEDRDELTDEADAGESPDVESSDVEPSEVASSDGMQSDAKPAGGKQSDAKPAGGKQSDAKPAGGKPSGVASSVAEPSDAGAAEGVDGAPVAEPSGRKPARPRPAGRESAGVESAGPEPAPEPAAPKPAAPVAGSGERAAVTPAPGPAPTAGPVRAEAASGSTGVPPVRTGPRRPPRPPVGPPPVRPPAGRPPMPQHTGARPVGSPVPPLHGSVALGGLIPPNGAPRSAPRPPMPPRRARESMPLPAVPAGPVGPPPEPALAASLPSALLEPVGGEPLPASPGPVAVGEPLPISAPDPVVLAGPAPVALAEPPRAAASRPVQSPVDRPAQRPGDRTGSRPGDRTGSRPGERTGTRPGERTGDRTEDRPAEWPGDRAGSRPAQRPGDRIANRPQPPADEGFDGWADFDEAVRP